MEYLHTTLPWIELHRSNNSVQALVTDTFLVFLHMHKKLSNDIEGETAIITNKVFKEKQSQINETIKQIYIYKTHTRI